MTELPYDLTPEVLERYVDLYQELHRNPELGLKEYRTAETVSAWLRMLGIEPITGLGGTGVVGVVQNGPGMTIMVRADMDALPVREATGLSYASKVTTEIEDIGQVSVSHACGHDLHVACQLAVVERMLDTKCTWQGTLVFVFQPGEETGYGARRMVEDGLFDKVPKPDLALAQHVGPAPVGFAAVHSDVVMGSSDNLNVRFIGKGGHASQPENCIDPILMAANFIVRVQSVISRRISSDTRVVVTVGAVQAGSMAAAIPDTALLKINVRSFDDSVLEAILGWIRDLAESEAMFWNAPKPEFEHVYHLPTLRNSPSYAERSRQALRECFGQNNILDIPPVSASEDFGILVEEANCESVYWFFGGMTEQSPTLDNGEYPSNHSPRFAPAAREGLQAGANCVLSVLNSLMKKE